MNDFINVKKSILFSVIIFLFLNNIYIFPADTDEVEGKIVRKIVYKGIKKVKKKEITAVIQTIEGAPLDMLQIEQDYQNLFALGYFDDIAMSTEKIANDPSGINLIFEFTEKPTIRKTIFRGNKNVSFGVLMEDVKLKRGDFLDLSRVYTDISAITDKYHKKGFNQVNVDYEIYKDPELTAKNQVDLIFIIEEGIETYVSEIIFEGNKNISTFNLKNKMKTKERKFLGLQKGTFIESDFRQDVEDLKNYYRDQGYYLVEFLEPEIYHYDIEEKGVNKEIITIKIHINEGDQYRYAGLTITGNKLFTSEDLKFGMKLREGQVFNYTKYQESLYILHNKYNEEGYIQTVINDKPIIDKEKKLISIEVTIIESKRSYIEAVYFKGNEKTKNYVLERAVTTEVGEIFNSNKLMSSIIQLYNLGFFSKVEHDIQQGSAPGLLKITYLLEEQSTAEFRFGLQIPANKWPPNVTLFGEIAEKNFVGREIQASAKLDMSLYKQGFTLSVDDPWFLNYPWSLGASVKFYHNWEQLVLRQLTQQDRLNYYHSKHNNLDPTNDVQKDEMKNYTDEDIRDWYNTNYANNDKANPNYMGYFNNDFFKMGVHNLDFEIATRTGYRFLKYFAISGLLSVEPIFTWMPYENNEDRDDFAYLDYDNATQNNNGWSVKAKVSSTFSINTTTRRVNPYDGFTFSFTTGYTFGHYDSVSINSKFTAYLKILDIYFGDWPFKNVVVFNAAVGMIFPGFRNLGGKLNDKETAGKGPIMSSSEFLIVDGLFSGRGWSNTLGMTDATDRFLNKRGYAKLDFSLEYRIPIYDQIVWAAGFIDMVNLIQGPIVDEKTNERGWDWWNQQGALGITNWYGSIGFGFEFTFPQLPLSFFIVKRFKINYYSGLEWVSQPASGDLDFVLSIVGYYF